MGNWFDGVVVLSVVGLIAWEMRQEAGRSLFDTVAALGAAHLAGMAAVPATAALKWRPLPGTEASPLALGLCFVALLALGLCASAMIHRQTRWTMDQFDPCFGMVFAFLIAFSIGHVFTETAAGMAIEKHGHVPEYLSNSFLGEELRSFRSYNYVLNVFHGYQEGR